MKGLFYKEARSLYKDISPIEVKEKVMKACIDLKDSKENQGAGMLNLRLLFNDEFEGHKNNLPKETFLQGDFMENIIMILVILFLLDSRI